MKSLFDTSTYQEIKTRLKALSPDAKRNWGEMDVAQMLHHCQKPILIAMDKETIKKPPFPLNLIMRIVKPTLYNDKPLKRNLPTAKELIVNSDKNFTEERQQLALLIDEFHNHKDKEDWKPHPIFGKFSKQQWGKMQYKHLNHHFEQFGV